MANNRAAELFAPEAEALPFLWKLLVGTDPKDPLGASPGLLGAVIPGAGKAARTIGAEAPKRLAPVLRSLAGSLKPAAATGPAPLSPRDRITLLAQRAQAGDTEALAELTTDPYLARVMESAARPFASFRKEPRRSGPSKPAAVEGLVSVPELVSKGTEATLSGLPRWKPEKTPFGPFAYQRTRGSAADLAARMESPVSGIPRQRESPLERAVLKDAQRYLTLHGRQPTPEELAKFMMESGTRGKLTPDIVSQTLYEAQLSAAARKPGKEITDKLKGILGAEPTEALEAAEQSALTDHLDRIQKSLPAKLQQALAIDRSMGFGGRTNYKAIAEKMGVPVRTAQRYLSDARKRVAEALGPGEARRPDKRFDPATETTPIMEKTARIKAAAPKPSIPGRARELREAAKPRAIPDPTGRGKVSPEVEMEMRLSPEAADEIRRLSRTAAEKPKEQRWAESEQVKKAWREAERPSQRPPRPPLPPTQYGTMPKAAGPPGEDPQLPLFRNPYPGKRGKLAPEPPAPPPPPRRIFRDPARPAEPVQLDIPTPIGGGSDLTPGDVMPTFNPFHRGYPERLSAIPGQLPNVPDPVEYPLNLALASTGAPWSDMPVPPENLEESLSQLGMLGPKLRKLMEDVLLMSGRN